MPSVKASWMIQLFLLPGILGLGHPALLHAQEEMSRADSAAMLFSNRFSFTPEKEPVLSIRIMEEQRSIEFSSPQGIVVHPSGPGGPAVTLRGGQRWIATVEQGQPGVSGYRIVLADVPTRDFQERKRAVAVWKERAIATADLELGTLFSFQGTVFDTRHTVLVMAGLFKTRDGARAARKQLKQQYPGQYRIEEVLAQRPTGTIRLSPKGSNSVEFAAQDAVWLDPLGDSLTVQDVEFAKGFAWHGRQTRTYGGSFYLAVDRFGSLAIANVLPAEKLLKGLVPAEIYPDSPAAALQAQAVAARNELFSKIGHRHLADPYLLCGDQHCQVYKGLDAERNSTSRAVEQTRGQVMFEGDGSLADARYHSTCGGHTEDSNEVWPGVNPPSLKGRWNTVQEPADPYAPVSDQQLESFVKKPPATWCSRSSKSKSTFRWTRTFTQAQMDDLVGKKHPEVGSVTAIEVLRRGVSGRANRISIVGGKGSVEVTGELVIRKLLGGLKSSMFILERVPASGTVQKWELQGGGFGHGAGMCQLGAAELARAGRSALEILRHFYRGVSVKRIY